LIGAGWRTALHKITAKVSRFYKPNSMRASSSTRNARSQSQLLYLVVVLAYLPQKDTSTNILLVIPRTNSDSFLSSTRNCSRYFFIGLFAIRDTIALEV